MLNSRNWKTAAAYAVPLFIFWFLLSGKTELFHLIVGLVSSIVIALIASRNSGIKQVSFYKQLIIFFKTLRYSIWLIGRIVLAAFHVSKLSVSSAKQLQPEIIKHKTHLKTEFERVLFANSITLTPGTITADISDDILTIYRIDEESSSDIDTRLMEKQIQRIFS